MELEAVEGVEVSVDEVEDIDVMGLVERVTGLEKRVRTLVNMQDVMAKFLKVNGFKSSHRCFENASEGLISNKGRK